MFCLGRHEFLALDATLLHIDQEQKYCAECTPIYFKMNDSVGEEKKPMVTYKANKNANGMLLLFPEAVMMASETKGPMNADVFPICSRKQYHVNLLHPAMEGKKSLTYDGEQSKK